MKKWQGMPVSFPVSQGAQGAGYLGTGKVEGLPTSINLRVGWDKNPKFTIYKIDNQQGPTV